jgi:hypothetical protein
LAVFLVPSTAKNCLTQPLNTKYASVEVSLAQQKGVFLKFADSGIRNGLCFLCRKWHNPVEVVYEFLGGHE